MHSRWKKGTFPLFSHCLDWVFRKILVNRLCFFCEEEKPQACQSPGLSYKLWFKNISKTEKYGKLRMESDFKLCNELERNVGLLKTNFTFNLPVLEKLLNIWAFRMYSPTIWCGAVSQDVGKNRTVHIFHSLKTFRSNYTFFSLLLSFPSLLLLVGYLTWWLVNKRLYFLYFYLFFPSQSFMHLNEIEMLNTILPFLCWFKASAWGFYSGSL